MPAGTLTAKADIATIPVFARAGSVLPLGPVVQYADEKTAEPIEIRVYPGADGSFALYDDAGDGHGYDKGEYAVVRIAWHDKARRLAFERRSGAFPGMRAQQSFVVRCGSAGGQAHRVEYTGQPASVGLPDCR